jgi:hypothetical protein
MQIERACLICSGATPICRYKTPTQWQGNRLQHQLRPRLAVVVEQLRDQLRPDQWQGNRLQHQLRPDQWQGNHLQHQLRRRLTGATSGGKKVQEKRGKLARRSCLRGLKWALIRYCRVVVVAVGERDQEHREDHLRHPDQ